MRSNVGRILLGVALLIAAIGMLLVLKDGGSDTDTSRTAAETSSKAETSEDAPPPQTGPDKRDGAGGRNSVAVPTVVLRNGAPVGGIADLSYSEGEQVRFKVASDVSDEVHVHGYDVTRDVEAGGSVSFNFPATIEGVFEVELENLGEQILEVRVNP